MQVHNVYFTVAVSIVLIGLLWLLVCAPWHQVVPGDPTKTVSLPRAPLWAHSDLPGASVNVGQCLLEALMILVIGGMVARIGLGTRTRQRPPKD